MKKLFFQQAISQIPLLISQLDANPHSNTYGSFDRNFWDYQITQTPNSLFSQYVWPLTLAYELNTPENPYYQQPVLREWIEAGLFYTSKTTHSDGSSQPNLPWEENRKVTAFSLLAGIESCVLLELDNQEILTFFEKRADWLSSSQSTPIYTHVLAAIVLCLELLSQLLKTSKWKRPKAIALEKIIEAQTTEGWFNENYQCDLSYHTLTLSYLARIYQIRPDIRLKEVMIKGVEFAAQFIYPNGYFASDLSSYKHYFYPQGFELIGRWFPDALKINDSFLQGLTTSQPAGFTDVLLCPQYTSNYFLAYRDFVSDRPERVPRSIGKLWFQQAQILIDRRNFQTSRKIGNSPPLTTEKTSNPTYTAPRPSATVEMYVSLQKGGIFKLFRQKKLIVSDTQFSVLFQQEKQIKNAVAYWAESRVEIKEEEVIIEGDLKSIEKEWNSPLQRVWQRFIPQGWLQFLRPVAQLPEPQFRFRRRLRWEVGELVVIDELECSDWQQVIEVGIGSSLNPTHSPITPLFLEGKLQPWLDLTSTVKNLQAGQVLKLERRF